MSWRQSITVRSRVFLDDNGAEAVVGKIRESANQIPDYWTIKEESFERGDGFVDISIKASGERRRAPGSDFGRAMDSIGALQGRSGGVEIYESDFGVDGYDLYGAATAREIDLSQARGFEWRFEDTLMLNVTMPAAGWRSILGDGGGALSETIEAAGANLLREKVVPCFFEVIDGNSYSVAFRFFDIEPFMPDGDCDDDEPVTVMYELDRHALSGEAFELILKGFERDVDNLRRLGARVLLCLENAVCKKGVCKNVVVDTDNMAILEFTSSDNAITNIRTCVIDGVGMTNSAVRS